MNPWLLPLGILAIVLAWLWIAQLRHERHMKELDKMARTPSPPTPTPSPTPPPPPPPPSPPPHNG